MKHILEDKIEQFILNRVVIVGTTYGATLYGIIEPIDSPNGINLMFPFKFQDGEFDIFCPESNNRSFILGLNGIFYIKPADTEHSKAILDVISDTYNDEFRTYVAGIVDMLANDSSVGRTVH